MGRLDNKVAVICGGANGVGRGIARRYAREGAAVVVADPDATAGAAVAAELAELGQAGVFVQCDLSDKAQIEQLMAEVDQRFDKLDVLVNNISAAVPSGVLEDKSDEQVEAMLRDGLWSTWWTMRAAFPLLRKTSGGSIINMYYADAAAWAQAEYNVTRATILALTRASALEWGRFNIYITAVGPLVPQKPGEYELYYQLATRKDPELARSVADANLYGLTGDPEEDVAPLAVMLATEDARYMTGDLVSGVYLPAVSAT